jgi:hypothetical protein
MFVLIDPILNADAPHPAHFHSHQIIVKNMAIATINDLDKRIAVLVGADDLIARKDRFISRKAALEHTLKNKK